MCRRALHNLFRETDSANLIQRQITFLQKSNDVINVSVAFQYLQDAARGLKVGGAFLTDENNMPEIEVGSFRDVIILFIIYENQKVIAKTVDLLGCFSKGTR